VQELRAVAHPAGGRVVRAGEHRSSHGVDAVHPGTVGAPGEAIREREIVIERADAAVLVETDEHLGARLAVKAERADDESAGRVGPAIVESPPAARGKEARPARHGAIRRPDQKLLATRDEPVAGLRDGDCANGSGERDAIDDFDGRLFAKLADQYEPATDVDPKQTVPCGIPHGTLAELAGLGVGHARSRDRGHGLLLQCGRTLHGTTCRSAVGIW
jgi:hypothetical protein